MRPSLALLLAACGDPVPEPTIDQGVFGSVTPEDSCEAPPRVDVYAALDGATPCDWSPEFDTGGDTGDWTDNVGEIVESPDVVSGTFEAELEVGSYEARVFADCYGCVAFDVTDGEVTEVDLVLNETVYADAPNIYLYPEAPTDVSVRLAKARHVVASEPEYPLDGWRVRALPDGTLQTPSGAHDFLFYELRAPALRLQREDGWCVPGHLAQASVEEAMALSGFLEPEIDDFAEFWDAYWPEAEWMTVYPQVRDLGRLDVDPVPDAVLRLWFLVEAGCAPVSEPLLPQVERTGFHVAEWGVVFDRAWPREWEVGR